MKISTNSDFFKKSLELQVTTTTPSSTREKKVTTHGSRTSSVPRTSGAIAMLVKQTADTLKKCGLPQMAARVEKILGDANNERFVVAVVGEFNRGKSTFITKFMENKILPLITDDFLKNKIIPLLDKLNL